MSVADFFYDLEAIYARTDLSPTEKHVAVVVLSFRNRITGDCCPAVVAKKKNPDGTPKIDLVTKSGLSDRAVQKAILSLEAKGIFQREVSKHAPAKFVFTVRKSGAETKEGGTKFTPNEVHPEQDSPLGGNVVRDRGERRSEKGGTSFPQTGIKQGIKQKSTTTSLCTRTAQSASAPSQARAPVPLVSNDSLFDEANFAAQEAADASRSTQDEPPYVDPKISQTDAKSDLPCSEPDAEGAPFKKPKSPYPPCQTQAVVDLYNKLCPTLQQVNVVRGTRRQAISARWRDLCHDNDCFTTEAALDGFEWFFKEVAASDFLMGRCSPGPRRERSFRASFDWLMKPTNFLKVCEGNYVNGK